MKKLVAIALTLGMAASVATGQSLIVAQVVSTSGWYAPNPVNDAGPGILDPSANPSQQALVQLILAPAGFLEPAHVQGGLTFLANDDVARGATILGSGVVSLPGLGGDVFPVDDFAGGFSWSVQSPFQSGTLFVRLFQGPAELLGVGDLYFESTGVAARETADASVIQFLEINRDEAFTGFGDLLTLPIVPEPSSLLLLGIGAFGVVAARRRKNM